MSLLTHYFVHTQYLVICLRVAHDNVFESALASIVTECVQFQKRTTVHYVLELPDKKLY